MRYEFDITCKFKVSIDRPTKDEARGEAIRMIVEKECNESFERFADVSLGRKANGK